MLPPSPPSSQRIPSEPRWSLLVAILGSAMAFIDGTVVNVALPVMQRALGGTVAQMQWVVEAYALLLASLVLVGGALGDRLGRRRVFVVGAVTFAVASAACGAAPSALALIVARAVQGVGAAMLVPGSLSLISAAYGEEDRGRAIGTWSAASAITTAIGPVLGGWVVEHASWRWIFFLNVPLGAAVVGLAGRIAETRDESAPARIDLLGASLAIIGLGAIVLALIEAPSTGGITTARTLGLLAFGFATLVAFVWVEARQAHPMVPLALFRSRTFAGTNLLTLLLYAALGGGLFFVPFNLVQVQGYSPAAAGASFLPFVALISVLSRWAGGLVLRYGARVPLVFGPLVAGAGFALLAAPTQGGAYWTTFFPGIVVLGLGMGVTVAPLTTAVMGSVDAHHAGVASGINNAVSRAAGLLAIAALGVVLIARFDRALDAALDDLAAPVIVRGVVSAQRSKLAGIDLDAVDPALRAIVRRAIDAAYVSAFRTVMLVCTGLAITGSLLAGSLVDPRAHRPHPTG
jgi:EmrB/QacA subfamily drug resistance transporter